MQSLQGYRVHPIKIIDDAFPLDEDCVALSKLTAEYVQPLDNCQSEDEHPDGCQTLTVTTDDGGGGKFIRIKTGEAGWSFSHNDDIADILTDFIKRLQCES